MNATHAFYETSTHIHNYECDFRSYWKPAAFFQHLSESAGAHAELLGVGFEAMRAQNLFWVHSRMKIKFLGFPKAGDSISIHTWPKPIQQKLFYMRDFEVSTKNGDLLANASSAWLVVNAITRRIVPPQSMEVKLPGVSDRHALAEPLERLGLAEAGDEKLRVTAGYSAVDLLGHVNNSRYVEWVCDTFPLEAYQRQSLDWMQVNYDREVLPGEEIAILANQNAEDSDLWEVAGVNRTRNLRAFEAKVHWR